MIRPLLDATPIASSVVETAQHADRAWPMAISLGLLAVVLLGVCFGVPELVRLARRRREP
jgi:hypothetical protein